jgi:hypothetical protein
MMYMNYPKKYYEQTLEVNEDVANGNEDGLAGWKKMQGNWVLEFGWQVPRIEVVDDIC